MKERWRSIAGYEGLYEVSDQGRVRSLTCVVSNGTGTRVRVGRELKCSNKDGYRVVSLSRASVVRRVKVSRLVAAAFVGPVEGVLVDHRDRNRRNDLWTNLRLASVAQNTQNSKTPAHNTGGIKGVSWDKVNRKWKATIGVGGKARQIGRFTEKEAAATAYAEAARAAFGEFACQG